MRNMRRRWVQNARCTLMVYFHANLIRRWERSRTSLSTYVVSIYFNSGEWHTLLAEEFDLDTEASGSAHFLVRFSYRAKGGEEIPIFLTPTQAAGIIVEPR